MSELKLRPLTTFYNQRRDTDPLLNTIASIATLSECDTLSLVNVQYRTVFGPAIVNTTTLTIA